MRQVPDVDAMFHSWHIDPREYERHETRRGRRHAYERVDATRTALVVIDMIPFFVESNPFVRGIVPNIGALALGLRSHGGVVAWVLPANKTPTRATTEFYGPEVARRYGRSAGDGPLRTRLWHRLPVAADDVMVEKESAGAFFPGHCELHSILRERGVDTLLVTGTVANVCCESTVREASALGYRVIMIADANAAARDEDLHATLHTVYRSFGDVRTTSDVLTLIGSASSETHRRA